MFHGPPEVSFGEGWKPEWPQGSGKQCNGLSIRCGVRFPQQIREVIESCMYSGSRHTDSIVSCVQFLETRQLQQRIAAELTPRSNETRRRPIRFSGTRKEPHRRNINQARSARSGNLAMARPRDFRHKTLAAAARATVGLLDPEVRRHVGQIRPRVGRWTRPRRFLGSRSGWHERPRPKMTNAVTVTCSRRTSTYRADVTADRSGSATGSTRINGTESRMLGTIGAFRVVSERDLHDLRDDSNNPRRSLRHLENEGLIRTSPLSSDDRAVVLTERGRGPPRSEPISHVITARTSSDKRSSQVSESRAN